MNGTRPILMRWTTALETPFGTMHLTVNDRGEVVEIDLPGRAASERAESADLTPDARTGLLEAQTQLEEYFDGKRRVFDLRLAPSGTDFELLVNGARAVGRANGANPIPIVIPCNRVIGADGTLVGYGGGMPLKRALLELEGAIEQPPLRLL